MMQNENIICFAKDWHEDPTSNNHIMRLLAQHNRVVWLNSTAMRRPSITSSRDWRKIGTKLIRFFRGAEHTTSNLWVVTPIVLPFPHSHFAVIVNRWILRVTINWYRRKLGMQSFQLWTFLPSAVDYIGTLGESLVVYYCTDDWSGFAYLDGNKMANMESRLLRKADVCFCTAHSLYEAKKLLNPNTFLALHGVDYEHFSKALSDQTVVPEDIASLPKPVIAFFGHLHHWIDIPLIAKIASTHPEWSIVLIGKYFVDISMLQREKNIHILGRREYATLPAYCKGFTVGIIPFLVNDMTRNVNPIKLREYLSAGLPVVSTDLPEVRHLSGIAAVAHTHAEFITHLENAILADNPSERKRRSTAMRSEAWEGKVNTLCSHLLETKKRM